MAGVTMVTAGQSLYDFLRFYIFNKTINANLNAVAKVLKSLFFKYNSSHFPLLFLCLTFFSGVIMAFLVQIASLPHHCPPVCCQTLSPWKH